MKDYYKILELDRECSSVEIKKSYRRLARLHHPDANQNSEESTKKFMEISEAYEVLGNDDKRKEYDRACTSGSKPKNARYEEKRKSQNAYDFDPRNFSNMFESFFNMSEDNGKGSDKVKKQVNNMFQNYFSGGKR